MTTQITSQQKKLIFITVENNKDLFNTPSTNDATKPFYHIQADAICWRDELPEKLSYNAMRVVQFLLAARSHSYVDSHLANSGVLEKLRAVAPDWPFLREDRHDSKWKKTLDVLRIDALRELESQLEHRKEFGNGQ